MNAAAGRRRLRPVRVTDKGSGVVSRAGGRDVSLSRIKVGSFSPVREEVFLRLREAILRGELQPGTRVVERELAEQLGVSRTPVREAFRKLEQEGLLGSVGRALVVREVSLQEAREVLQIRAALEGLAAEMAAANAEPRHLARFDSLLAQGRRALAAGDTGALARLNDRFNATLYAAAGSARLTGMLLGLRDQAARLAAQGYEVPGRAAAAAHEHAEIVAAIAGRDAEGARRAAWRHVKRSEESLLAAAADVGVGAEAEAAEGGGVADSAAGGSARTAATDARTGAHTAGDGTAGSAGTAAADTGGRTVTEAAEGGRSAGTAAAETGRATRTATADARGRTATAGGAARTTAADMAASGAGDAGAGALPEAGDPSEPRE